MYDFLVASYLTIVTLYIALYYVPTLVVLTHMTITFNIDGHIQPENGVCEQNSSIGAFHTDVIVVLPSSVM